MLSGWRCWRGLSLVSQSRDSCSDWRTESWFSDQDHHCSSSASSQLVHHSTLSGSLSDLYPPPPWWSFFCPAQDWWYQSLTWTLSEESLISRSSHEENECADYYLERVSNIQTNLIIFISTAHGVAQCHQNKIRGGGGHKNIPASSSFLSSR